MRIEEERKMKIYETPEVEVTAIVSATTVANGEDSEIFLSLGQMVPKA